MNIKKIIRGISRYNNWISIALDIIKKKKPTYVKMRQGCFFYGPSNSDLIGMISDTFYNQSYNTNYKIKNGDIVIDIGANIGVFSIYAAYHGAKEVIAVEPGKNNYDFIIKNRDINNFSKNIKIINAAVSSENGYVLFSEVDCNEGHHVVKNDINNKSKNVSKISAITLEQIFTDYNLDKIDFLKIDCEGSEGDIFKSLPENILERINNIGLEFHDHMSVLNHDQIGEILKKAGFTIKIKWDGASPFGFIIAGK